MKICKYSIILIGVILLQFSLYAYADTIITQEGKDIKGIVVEDYKDRVIFSTADGELTLLKSDIRELYYDSEEENLIKLAEQSREKKDFVRSFIYYDKALKINPQSKRALEGVVFLQGYLFRKEQVQKEEDVKKREAIENYGTTVVKEPNVEDKAKVASENLKNLIGLTLKIDEGLPVVESVKLKSPAQEAGVEKGDRLIAVWSKLTGYLSLEEVTDMLLDKPSLELKCTIERDVKVQLDFGGAIGASFAMEFDGLTISGVREGGSAFTAGLKKGDLITSINGQSVRYMSLRDAVAIIKRSKDRIANLTIRREALIWRKD